MTKGGRCAVLPGNTSGSLTVSFAEVHLWELKKDIGGYFQPAVWLQGPRPHPGSASCFPAHWPDLHRQHLQLLLGGHSGPWSSAHTGKSGQKYQRITNSHPVFPHCSGGMTPGTWSPLSPRSSPVGSCSRPQ